MKADKAKAQINSKTEKSKKNKQGQLPAADLQTGIRTMPETGGEEELLDEKAKGAMLFTLMPVLSLLAIILLGLLKEASILDLAKIGTLTLVLTAASVFFIRLQEESILKKKYAKSIIISCYLISILLIMLPIKPELYSFWMVGALLIAMLVDARLGLLIYFNLTFILSVTVQLPPESIIYFLILGVLKCLLAGAIRNKNTVIYAAVILLSTNVTLAFVINNFIFDAASNHNYLASFFSILGVLIAAFLLAAVYDRLSKGGEAKEQKESSEELSGQEVYSVCRRVKSGSPFFLPEGDKDKLRASG